MVGRGKGRGRGRGGGGTRGSRATQPQATQNEHEVTSNATENSSVAETENVLDQDQDHSEQTHGQSPNVHSCGMCGHPVGQTAIGCDRCSGWVHPTEMCSGLPSDAISTIADLSGDAVLFICTNCRIQPSDRTKTRLESGDANSGHNQLIQQLFLSVKGICSAVMGLTAKMDRILSENQNSVTVIPQPQLQAPVPGNPTQPTCPGPASHPESDEYRSVIRQEMREIQERAKRKQSVIIKGMHANTPRELINKFGDLSLTFTGIRVELTDIVPIPNHSDLFRAKILNDDNRKLVLERAKTLRDTEHASVFIRRDLTFAQRKELRERRAQRTDNAASEGHVQASGGERSTPRSSN